MTSSDVKDVTARTAEKFRGPLKEREFAKASEAAEQLANGLKKNHIEDRSTLVNDSTILRKAIEQVLSFLESVRVLKVLVNYWNLIFAMLGKEIIISRDPENQLQMKVVDSSVVMLLGEADFRSLSTSIKLMFGDKTKAGANTKDEVKLSALGDRIADLENENVVVQEMINQLTEEKARISYKLLDAKARQSKLENDTDLSGDEEMTDGSDEAGSERRKQRNLNLEVLVTSIASLEAEVAEREALTEQMHTLLAEQTRELTKLNREQSVRRRTTRFSVSGAGKEAEPTKVNDAAVDKALALHDAINEVTYHFLPKANSSMGRSWEKWRAEKQVDGNDILSLLYFWWDTLNAIWRETGEATTVSRRLRGASLTAYSSPRTLLDSASFINYVSRYQSDVCLYNSINTSRPWSQPGLPILHLLGIYQQQQLIAMSTNNIQSFAWFPLASVFEDLARMDTQDIEEMEASETLALADRLQAALDNWFTRKRELINTVGGQTGNPPPNEETNAAAGSFGSGPAEFTINGEHFSFPTWDLVPQPIMNRLIAHLAQKGVSGAGSGDRSGKKDQGSKEKRVCFSFRDTGTCSNGNNCRFEHDRSTPAPASNSRATSDASRRRERADFTKAGPCPHGPDCPQHPFYACWTFGTNLKDEVIALAPKKGPLCQYNHSREADGKVTAVHLSRRKLILDARRQLRLEKEKAAAGTANLAEEEEAQLTCYLTSDSEDDDDCQETNAAFETNAAPDCGSDDEINAVVLDSGTVDGEACQDGDTNNETSASESSDDDDNLSDCNDLVPSDPDIDNDRSGGNGPADEAHRCHFRRSPWQEANAHWRPAMDSFTPRISNESKIANSDSRVRATPWNVPVPTTPSDVANSNYSSGVKDSIYLAIITALLALLIGLSLNPFPAADGAVVSRCTDLQWEHLEASPYDLAQAGSARRSVNLSVTRIAQQGPAAHDALMFNGSTARAGIRHLAEHACAHAVSPVRVSFPATVDEHQDRLAADSETLVGPSNHPANRDDLALALMYLFDTVATSDFRLFHKMRKRFRRAPRRRTPHISGATSAPALTQNVPSSGRTRSHFSHMRLLVMLSLIKHASTEASTATRSLRGHPSLRTLHSHADHPPFQVALTVMLMSIAIAGVIRSSSIESIDAEDEPPEVPPEQVQNPATVENPVAVPAGPTAVVPATVENPVPPAATATPEEEDDEYYSADSQDESWKEVQLAERELGEQEEESGDASSLEYSSVSDDDEPRSLSEFRIHRNDTSDDGSHTGSPPTGALRWVCTNGESDEEDNPGGDEVYHDNDRNTHPYKWSLKNPAGDIVGVFEGQAQCWGCDQGWKAIPWSHTRTRFDLLNGVSQGEHCSVPGCTNKAYKFCRLPPQDGSTDFELAHKHLHQCPKLVCSRHSQCDFHFTQNCQHHAANIIYYTGYDDWEAWSNRFVRKNYPDALNSGRILGHNLRIPLRGVEGRQLTELDMWPYFHRVNGSRPCSGIGCSYHTLQTDGNAATNVFCSVACEEALKDELYSVRRGRVCSAPGCIRGSYPCHLDAADALSFLRETRHNPTWYQYCSERCSNWKRLSHGHTPLGMARSYMHFLRHIHRDDGQQPHRSDHRVDTINRTRSCECDECVSTRNGGQPDPDEFIIQLENDWFDQNDTDDHGHLAEHPSDEREFSESTKAVTAARQSVHAGLSSAGTGAGLTSAGTGAGCSEFSTTNRHSSSAGSSTSAGTGAGRSKFEGPQAGMSIDEAGAGLTSAGTGAGCSGISTTNRHSSPAGLSMSAATECSRHLCTEATSRTCGYYSSHLNANGNGPCQHLACDRHPLCPFHQTQESERLVIFKLWELSQSKWYHIGNTIQSPFRPGASHPQIVLCARPGCTHQSIGYAPSTNHAQARKRQRRTLRASRPRATKMIRLNYCSNACRFVHANGALLHRSECAHPECFLDYKRTGKQCVCSKHCSSMCHDTHRLLLDEREREHKYSRREERRAAHICSNAECVNRKAIASELCRSCDIARKRDALPVATLCHSHIECLRPNSRNCSSIHTEFPDGEGELEPCQARVCSRANHRFCAAHSRQCRARDCDQPAMYAEDVERDSDGESPRQELLHYCGEQCTPVRRRASRREWVESCRKKLDEVTHPSAYIHRHHASYHRCLSGSGAPRGLTSPNGKRGTGKRVGTQAKSSPTLASTWLTLATASACITSAEGANVVSPARLTIINSIVSCGHIFKINPFIALVLWCLLAVVITLACHHITTTAASASPTTTSRLTEKSRSEGMPNEANQDAEIDSRSNKKSRRRLTWVQPGHRTHALAVSIYGIEYVNSCKLGTSGPDVDVAGQLTWLLVDTGSTIHVCKDRSKLINIRKKATRIAGIVGGAVGISQEVGDWPLAINNSNGKTINFTLKNVALMENASRNIISTAKLSKHFWWPSMEKQNFYHRNPHTGMSKIAATLPFYPLRSGLMLLPAFECNENAATLNAATKEKLIAVTKGAAVDEVFAVTKTRRITRSQRKSMSPSNKASTGKVTRTRRQLSELQPTDKRKTSPSRSQQTGNLKYSLWYGGSGAVCEALGNHNCVSYFDHDANCKRDFETKCPAAVTSDSIEEILASPTRFIKATQGVDYVHVTPPCSSYSRGGAQLGLRSGPGQHMLKFFELLKLVPNVPMVGVENVANFLKFDDARKGFTARARKLGYRTHIKVMNSSDYGSVQGLRNRMYVILIKHDYAQSRPRWSHPSSRQRRERPPAIVDEILSANRQESKRLEVSQPFKIADCPNEPWYRGPTQVGVLSNAPFLKEPMHPQNRGYKVFATNGKAAVITSTSDLAPGGATQLYLDKRFDRPIVRQLTVREAHSVMGKPFSLDTSEQDREEKLRILGQSEDGYLARAWARKVKQYAANESDEVRLIADSGLHWTKEEAHARCLHYGDWCLNLLGLAALKDNCKECALAGLKRTAKSTVRQTPVPEVNYRWGCDIIGKMRPKEKGKNVMQYSLVVIDYHSNKVWNRNYHSKSETLSKFKEIMHAAKHEAMPDEIQCGDHPLVSESIKDYCKDHKIKVLGPSKLGPHKLRADSDSVFKSEAYQKLCEKHSIGQEFSSPGDQFYNGKVERAIGTLKRKMHTVLKASGLSMQYWPEALDYCVYVYNRLPCSANLLNLSPFHMYTGRPPHIGHLRAFGCTCTYRIDKNADHGSGHEGLFLGFSKQCPRGTYLIEVKGKRKGTTVDSRHVSFDEKQVLPKFKDATANSHAPSDADSLLQAAPRVKRSKHVKTLTSPDTTSTKTSQPKLKKFLAQELVDEQRVLVPGPKFVPTTGNRAKYITDRLQMLLGLRPQDTSCCKFQKKDTIASYTMGDCAYDLNMGYLSLADRSSDIGSASINVCNLLTSKPGSLTDAVSAKMTEIDMSSTGIIHRGAQNAFERRIDSARRDIDGGLTASNPMDAFSSSTKTAQPYLHDPSEAFSRDERAQIVKADHLGVVTGVDITLEAPNGEELCYSLINDEFSHLVINNKSSMIECVNMVNPDEDVPNTFAQILKHDERKEWLASVLEEYVNLASKGTWRIALIPKGRKLLGCRLVMRRKVDKHGNLSKRKSRCVIQGYTQEEGIDYHRLFQPVAALDTLRQQCVFGCQLGEDLKSWDFEQAFVQSDLDLDLYIRWPPGIKQLIDPSGRQTALLVKRAQYGAKQSPRCWGLKLHKFLTESGFRRSSTDSCLYLMDWKSTDGRKKQIALVVYVDDLLARVNLSDPETKQRYETFVDSMQTNFAVEDRGHCDHMLGYKIDYDKKRGILKMTQKSCLLALLARTGHDDSPGKSTPASPGIKPNVNWCPNPDTPEGKDEIAKMKSRDYANRVGSANWLARGSKPETSWTAGMLSRFLHNPGEQHWKMTDYLMQYFSRTRDRGLVFRRDPKGLTLKAYVDGDWLTDYGNDTDNRKCCTGYALILGGAAVSWRSFKQQRVAGSSTESEYYSLWAVTRTVMHVRRQMKECGFEQLAPTVVLEDNKAVQRLSEDVVDSTRTRHWDKEYHQIREEFERETIVVEYVNTSLNSADCLTKSLCERLHRLHTDVLCGLDWNADDDSEYQEELIKDQRSEVSERSKAMLDLEHLSDGEQCVSTERSGGEQCASTERSTDEIRSEDNFENDSIRPSLPAEEKKPVASAGSDALLSKYLLRKEKAEAKENKRKKAEIQILDSGGV